MLWKPIDKFKVFQYAYEANTRYCVISHIKAQNNPFKKEQVMKIGGLQKLTLLDFPGHVACTVFLQGCNFRCPFCHNTPLLVGAPELPQEDLLSFLKKRQGLLDGVAVTGGEPLLSPEIEDLLKKIKDLGYAVKLDSNGSFPERLRGLIEKRLVDYVAMDIKNSPEKYDLTAGATGFLSRIEESVSFLKEGNVPYEFRTTVVSQLHEAEDFHRIGAWLKGAQQYFLQGYVDSGDILTQGLSAASKDEMEHYLTIVREYIPHSQLRGI